MTTDETRTINDKLDVILACVNGMENEFATLTGELRANIGQTLFQIIAVYAGAIGITFALIRLYGA